VPVPKPVGDVLAHLAWREAMIVEPCTLRNLVSCSFAAKSMVACRWIVAIKVGLGGIID